MEGVPLPQRLLARFLRLFFRLLYHEFAFTYDWVAWIVSVGRWQSWVQTTLPYLPGPRVLEIGHGPGHLQVALLERGIKPVGLDRSPQMGGLASTRIRSKNYAPRLCNGQGQFLPFAGESFHQVTATFPSEYIFDPRTLAEIQRVLVPQGRLILLPVAWISGRSLPDRLAAGLFRITGQAPAWDQELEQKLSHLPGFRVQYHQVDLGTSRVVILEAEKV